MKFEKKSIKLLKKKKGEDIEFTHVPNNWEKFLKPLTSL
jgi:hypothetical protein